MDLQTRVSILQVFLGVGLVGFAYAHMYRKTRTDRYREDLFTLRDALFDYMWENRVPFDLPAYRLTRQLLNGAIRAADSVSLWSLLLVAVFVRRQQWHEDRLSVALDAIPDPALRSHFRDVRVQFGHRLGRFLVAEGILGPFLALLATPTRLSKAGVG